MLPPSRRAQKGTQVDTIEQVVRQTIAPYDGDLPVGAEAVVNDVIVALREREYRITDTLSSAARAQGLNADLARSEMEQAGLTFRPALRSVGSDTLTEEAWRDRAAWLNSEIDKRMQQWKDELGI